MRGQGVDAALDLLEEVRDVLVVERERPAEEGVEDDTQRPHVHLTGEEEMEEREFECRLWRDVETLPGRGPAP